jgi:KDO2-lipid IV(A) lauroyltransferase
MSYIPISIGHFLGKLLGRAVGMIPMQRNVIAFDNIQQCFGGLMEKSEIEDLYRRVLKHFGQMLFEIPHLLRFSHGNLSKYVVFKGEDHLLKALEKNKGVFFLTAHFGNWEFMAVAIAIRFGKLAVVARSPHFPPFEKLLDHFRSRFGTEIIPKQNGMKKIFYALKKKKMIGILLDQNVDWYLGIFVNFLGRQACSNKGLALMALRTQTPVIPCFSMRRKDGRYNIIFGEELELISTGDITKDIEENTALFTGIIEKHIKERPDHWFWFHRRWKTLPYCTLPDKETKKIPFISY